MIRVWQLFFGFYLVLLGIQAQGQNQKLVIPPAKPTLPVKTASNPFHEKKKAIIAVLQKQQEDWNRGDLKAFMNGYWNSDTLRLVTVRGVNYGWEKMLASYKKTFPDSASMGKLDYDVIHVELICETDVLVTGKWLLNMNKKFKGGYFTFLFRKLKGKWVIVVDHTS